MDIFKDHNLLEFADLFKTDENSKESLIQIMRHEDYSSRKCSNKSCKIHECFSKTYNSIFLIHLKSYFYNDVLY